MSQNLLKCLICLALMIALLGMALTASDSSTGKLLASIAIVFGSVAYFFSTQQGRNQASKNFRD
nr:hypothetical protein [Cytophagales bacterium]